MTEPLAIALITGTIGFITSIIAIVVGWFNVKDLREIIAALREEVKELRGKVKELEDENADLKNWIERLVCQIKDAGMKPVDFFRWRGARTSE
jgi:cell division protein FtsB